MFDYQDAAQRYIDAWNASGAERRALVARTFTDEGRYADPLMQAQGHAALDAMIGAAQARFGGLRFSLNGRPDGFGDRLRFSWALGAGGEPVAEGTDFATIHQDGRFAQVSGFIDRMPQGA